MGLMDMLRGGSKKEKIQEMLNNGAVVIDVRTRGEFQGGHVAGSTNIPLQEIENNVDKIIGMKKPIVLCCASGMRSGQASNFLKSKGVECENGGGWASVNAIVV